jgi:CheY-like chemotaxis protein
VRTLTTLHGGTVTAHSDGPGKGSEFIVRLPPSMPPVLSVQAPTRQVQRELAAASVRQVLVVDDNRDGADMIAHVLSAAGHDVRVANDPLQALALADTFRPQVAILDIGLPVMDGYTLAHELRARLEKAAPIFIALTGYGHDQDKRRSEEAGFALHLVKPVDVEKLVQAVDAFGPDRSPDVIKT